MLFLFVFVILTMLISFLINTKYFGFRLFGISLETGQENHEEVKRIVSSYRKKIALLAGLFIILIIAVDYMLKGDSKLIAWIISPILYMLLGYRLIELAREDIKIVKSNQGWDLEKDVRYVDTKVLSEPTKGVIPTYFIWLIWLIWPLVIFIQSRTEGGKSLDFISFIGPIIMLMMPILYKGAINIQNQPISEDSEINIAFNDKIKRNNSITIFWSFLFLQLVMVFMDQINNGGDTFSLILLILAIGIGVIGITGYGYIKQTKIEKEFAPYKTIHTPIEKGKYHWGFYFNKEDNRIFVPKLNPNAGWTINFGRQAGKLIGVGSLIVVALLMGGVLFISSKDIEYTFTDQAFEIKAPMYDRKVEYDSIDQVKLSDEKLSASRTNGYGGAEKAYGHFRVEGYGNTMFYCYHDVKDKIFIKLKDKPEKWYILNDKTPEATKLLYEKLEMKE